MAFKQRNTLTGGFILLTAIAFVFGFQINSAMALTPFQDNFDLYDVGNLAGQGGWATTTTGFLATATTTESFSEPVSIRWDSSENSSIKKTGTQVSSGRWAFWLNVKTDDSAGPDNEWGVVQIAQGTINVGYIRIECYNEDCSLTNELARIQNFSGGIKVPLCDIPTNEWTSFQVEWNNETPATRWKCADNEWTEWVAQGPFDYVDTFELSASDDTGKIKINIDNIATEPTPACDSENCNLCFTSGSCLNASCSWYYSIYLQEWYCTPFYESPDECGSFYNCQYCQTLITCEEEVQCEWTDRGQGSQCYMVEPVSPPEAVEWEVPELDECGLLSGVELILCEIKNFIAGIFMPSQEKIESLYQTIGAFKEKLPFNYLGSLNDFFDSIRDSFESSKTIPIKILGSESEVDFDFWNSTTTIGGQVETFKNAIHDFTTIIVVLVWFVYLISVVKRFF